MRRALHRPFISLCIALISCVSSSGFAAEKKTWHTVDSISFVEDENNDGDSFHVKDGKKTFFVRLYYVDAPETKLTYPERVREQSVHFGITLDETLKVGEQARVRVRELLSKPFKIHTRWASGAGRGKLPRYLALVEVDGLDLGELLIKEGLARSKGTIVGLPGGEKAAAAAVRLDALESEAKAQAVGAWSLSKTPAPAAATKQTSENP